MIWRFKDLRELRRNERKLKKKLNKMRMKLMMD